MTTEIKRDLAADLAICEAATVGPWTNFCDVKCEDTEYVTDYDELTESGGDLVATFERVADATFTAEAREGWPHAIRRAVAAETERDALREIVSVECPIGALDLITSIRAERAHIAEELDAEEQRRRTFEQAADELAYDNGRLRKVIIDMLAAIDRGDLIRARMSSGVDYVVECAREALEHE